MPVVEEKSATPAERVPSPQAIITVRLDAFDAAASFRRDRLDSFADHATSIPTSAVPVVLGTAAGWFTTATAVLPFTKVGDCGPACRPSITPGVGAVISMLLIAIIFPEAFDPSDTVMV